jgi:hypothetical protein
MSVSRFGLAALGGAVVLLLQACATSRAKFPTQHYVPVSRAMRSWGTLELDDKHLRLEAFKGEMKLQYAGKMPEKEGSNLSGASVYRVQNADKYFKANSGGSSWCARPARWVAVSSRNGAPAWSGEIWMALLTVDDWTRYSDERTGYCAGGKYVLLSNDATPPE